MPLNNTLQAFSSAAGISAVDLSLAIRTFLLSGFLIWSAWCALELMRFHKEHYKENISRLFNQYTQLFFLISIVVALVFIP